MLASMFVLCVFVADPVATDFMWPLKPFEKYRKDQNVFNVYVDESGINYGYHFGEDWNKKTGGNSDLGDPIYCIGNGVVETIDLGTDPTWGQVLVVRHRLIDGRKVWSVYAHVQDVLVQKGEVVDKDQVIATIGNANGQYLSHLHFEIKEAGPFPPSTPAYQQVLTTSNTTGYLIPSVFISCRLESEAKRFILPNSWVRVPLKSQAPTNTSYLEVDGRLYSMYDAVRLGKVKLRAKQAGFSWVTVDDPGPIYFPLKDDYLKLEVRAKKAGTKLTVFPINLDDDLVVMEAHADILSASRVFESDFRVNAFKFEKMVVLPIAQEEGGIFFEGFLSYLPIKTNNGYVNGIYHFHNANNPFARVVSFTYNDTIFYQWQTSGFWIY